MNKLNPFNAIKRDILLSKITELENLPDKPISEMPDDEIEQLFEVALDATEALYEFNDQGERAEGLPWNEYQWPFYTKAWMLQDGTTVAWEYYYGGGKHAEYCISESISEPYYVKCEQQARIVRIYTEL